MEAAFPKMLEGRRTIAELRNVGSDLQALRLAPDLHLTGGQRDQVHRFRPDFSWIDLPIFHEDRKEPMHHRGIVADEPGLYFVGLYFPYAMSSGFFRGVGRDAEHVVEAIASRAR